MKPRHILVQKMTDEEEDREGRKEKAKEALAMSKAIYIRPVDMEDAATSTADLIQDTSVYDLSSPNSQKPTNSEGPPSNLQTSVYDSNSMESKIIQDSNIRPRQTKDQTGRGGNENIDLKDMLHDGFIQTLSVSKNPIFDMFVYYRNVIQDEWKLKLLRASALEAAVKTPKLACRVFDMVSNEIDTLAETAMKHLRSITICEKTAKQLIRLKHLNPEQIKSFQGSFHQFSRSMGQLQSDYIQLEMRLAEYRVLFENLQSVPLSPLLETALFENCYGSFLISQSKVVELHNRITSLKEAYNMVMNMNRTNQYSQVSMANSVNDDINSPHDDRSTMNNSISSNTSASIIQRYQDNVPNNNQLSKRMSEEDFDVEELLHNLHAATKTIDLLREELENAKLDLFDAEQVLIDPDPNY